MPSYRRHAPLYTLRSVPAVRVSLTSQASRVVCVCVLCACGKIRIKIDELAASQTSRQISTCTEIVHCQTGKSHAIKAGRKQSAQASSHACHTSGALAESDARLSLWRATYLHTTVVG